MGLRDKASKIDFGTLPQRASAPTDAPPKSAPADLEGRRPKTAPGFLMAHSSEQRSELIRENEALKAQAARVDEVEGRLRETLDELKGWDGAKATRLIDPVLIRRSKWANRDVRGFDGQDFEALKGEIANAGGNVQPIKVRPLQHVSEGQPQYELVYGHRRHEACRQLGLSVLAVVENLDDQALFVEMDRENRGRKDLSAWEQGVMYRRALDEKLYPSNRRLADAVGVDLTNLGRALALADLPTKVVAAFPSPLDLQFRWAAPLKAALAADEKGVLKKADELTSIDPRPAAKAVLERLTGVSGQGGSTVLPSTLSAPIVTPIETGGHAIGTITYAPKRGLVAALPGASAAEAEALAKLIADFYSKRQVG